MTNRVSQSTAGAVLGIFLVAGAPSPGATPPAVTPDCRHWVFFSEKPGAAAATRDGVDLAAPHLSERAIRRRILRRTAPGLFDERDLPIAASNITEVEQAGASIHISSRWLNAVSITADAAAIERIKHLRCVARIEPVKAGRRSEKLPSEGHVVEEGVGRGWEVGVSGGDGGGGVGGVRGAPIQGAAFDQLDQIGVTDLHDAGFTGLGVVIGVLDTGFKRQHAVFNQPGHALQVVAEHDFIFNDAQTANEAGDAADQHNHGSMSSV